jgi:hypothetical protein
VDFEEGVSVAVGLGGWRENHTPCLAGPEHRISKTLEEEGDDGKTLRCAAAYRISLPTYLRPTPAPDRLFRSLHTIFRSTRQNNDNAMHVPADFRSP